MTITAVKTVTVLVSDQDRAKSFYIDTLGFDLKADTTDGDHRWLEVAAADGTTLVLLLPFPGASAGGGRGTLLASDDLDADAERLRAAGTVVDGPEETPWGRQATFADPDGNSYALQG